MTPPGRRYCFIAYFYPPWGGVATQWTVKLIKHLDRVGWQASVVTVHESAPWLIDEGAAADLPADVRVRRARNFDLPARLLKQRVRRAESAARGPGGRRSLRASIVRLVRYVYDNYYVLEGQLPWMITATIAGLGPARRSDVILATIRPPSAGLAGVLLKRLTGKPLVLDYRDFWTQAKTVPAGGLRLAVEEWLERRTLAAADHVVASSQGVLDSMREKFGTAFAASALPLGFDPDDAVAPSERSEGPISIVYAGSFLATRTPEVFLRGLRLALDRDAALATRLTVDFYGVFGGPANEALVDELDLRRVIRIHGFVDHARALDAIRAADWLLLVIETLPNWDGIGNFTGAYTSKLFEYLGAGRPILAMTPPSLAAKLIVDARAGVIVPNDDPATVATAIEDISAGRYRGLVASRNEALVREYGMDRLARRLAAVFDQVTAERRAR